jgi:hypothetical protein
MGIKIVVAKDNPKVEGLKQKELKVALRIITKENHVRYEKFSHINAIKHEKGDPPRFSDNSKYPPPLENNLAITPKIPVYLWTVYLCLQPITM